MYAITGGFAVPTSHNNKPHSKPHNKPPAAAAIETLPSNQNTSSNIISLSNPDSEPSHSTFRFLSRFHLCILSQISTQTSTPTLILATATNRRRHGELTPRWIPAGFPADLRSLPLRDKTGKSTERHMPMTRRRKRRLRP